MTRCFCSRITKRANHTFIKLNSSLKIKLSFVGILLSINCHEKAITFDGATLFQILLKLYCNNGLNPSPCRCRSKSKSTVHSPQFYPPLLQITSHCYPISKYYATMSIPFERYPPSLSYSSPPHEPHTSKQQYLSKTLSLYVKVSTSI
jgi:hypothetical protein